MSLYPDDWRLRHENSREGELYREKERLEQELEQQRDRRRQEEYEQQQNMLRFQEQRREEQVSRSEQQMYLSDLIQARDEDLEDLKLRNKLGIEEGW